MQYVLILRPEATAFVSDWGWHECSTYASHCHVLTYMGEVRENKTWCFFSRLTKVTQRCRKSRLLLPLAGAGSIPELNGSGEEWKLRGTVVVGDAGRGLDADDLGAAVVCWQVLLPQHGESRHLRLCWRMGQFNWFIIALTLSVSVVVTEIEDESHSIICIVCMESIFLAYSSMGLTSCSSWLPTGWWCRGYSGERLSVEIVLERKNLAISKEWGIKCSRKFRLSPWILPSTLLF